MTGPVDWLRQRTVAPVHDMLWTSRFPGEQYTDPVGDKGLFGPGSPAWRVHSDPSMFVGGLCAILIQMLHPLAMAGVADHSNWVADPIKRLSRTASFVTATTFASTEVAEGVIQQVKLRHARINGTAPDGRSYRADDPSLLCWVHTAQVSSFLRAHLQYHPDPISPSEQDRYFHETSEVARRLGATDVPSDRREVSAYFRSMEGKLSLSSQGREALIVLQGLRLGGFGERAGFRIFFNAAKGLTPPWAQEQLHVGGSKFTRAVSPSVLSILRRVRGKPPWLVEAESRTAG